MMKKYKFSFVCSLSHSDIWNLKSNKFSRNVFLHETLLDSYKLRHDIAKREKTELITYYGGSWEKKVQQINWEDTIYNLKLKCFGPYSMYKVSFKVKLTPREAYILGKELEDMYNTVTYREIG